MTEEWPAYPGLPPTGGFTADPTTAPTLRASNADRAHAAALLDGAYAEGRITATELAERQWGVTAAVTLGDLAPLVADVELPSVADPSSSRLPVPYEPDPLPYRPAMRDLSEASPEADAESPESERPAERRVWGVMPVWWVRMTVFLVVLWLVTGLASGSLQYFWPIWPIVGTGIYYLMGARQQGRSRVRRLARGRRRRHR